MISNLILAAVGAASIPSAYAAAAGQPAHAGTGPGTWEIIGDTGVSAQQLFLGTENKVYVIDKTQNNVAQINGHPAWATGTLLSLLFAPHSHFPYTAFSTFPSPRLHYHTCFPSWV